jgi:hypothetical protein
MASGLFVPQLVTPVDTSFLKDIGNTIGTLKQDSEIADILKGIDPYDPNSKSRVINDLRQHSKEGRDMADRMEGLDIRRQATTQQGEYQKGLLGVSQGNLTLAQQKAAREQEQAADFTKGMADYRKQFGGGGGGLAGIPPTSAAPSAPAAAPAPRAVAPVDVAPGEKNYWDDPTEEEGGTRKAAPIIRAPRAVAPSAAPQTGTPVVGGFATQPAPGVQAAGGLLATGAAPQAAPVQAAPVPAPQQLFPSVAGPIAAAATRAAAPSFTPAAAAAPAPAAPVATGEPTEEPEVEETPPAAAPRAAAIAAGRNYTPRQIELRNANRFLAQMMSHPGATAARARGIQAQIAENDAEFAEIEAERTKGSKGEEVREKAETAADVKAKFELAKEMNAKMKRNVDLRDSLKAMQATVSSPNYPSGITAAPYMWLGGLAIEANRIMKNVTGKGFEEGFKDVTGQHVDGEGWYDRWVQDPVSRLRMAQKLGNTITLQMLGGTLAREVSNADRDFVKRMNAALGDDPESVKRLIATQLAYMDREDTMQQIVSQGINGKKTSTQIHARLRRYGQENPLFEGTATSEKIGGPKEGEPTALSRRIDPDNARKWDAKQQREREKAAATREEFRDPGEGAAMGYRPSVTEKIGTKRRDEAVERVQNRAVEGAGSSREPGYGPAGLERAQADVEAVTGAPGTAIQRGQAGARELLRGDNPATRFFQGPGRMTYGSQGVPIPAGQRAEETDPVLGNTSIRGIMEQGPRLAPNGIPWESMRRSTNVENRPVPNETPMPMIDQLAYANNWASGRDHLPAGPLSWQAGLADLSAEYPRMRERTAERELREVLGDRMYDKTDGGRFMPGEAPTPGPPMTLPPLPRPKPRPPGAQSKATEEAERRRRNAAVAAGRK